MFLVFISFFFHIFYMAYVFLASDSFFLAQVICIKLGKEVLPYSDRIMNILVEVFKNRQAVAQVNKIQASAHYVSFLSLLLWPLEICLR